MVTVLILQIFLFASAVAQWFTRSKPAPDLEKEEDNKTEYSF